VSWRDRVSRLRLDTTPLRESRDFRLLTYGGTVFYLGGMVSYVAVPYQLYHLTGSNFAVGALGIVELVPLVVFGLYGGALADHVSITSGGLLCVGGVLLAAGWLRGFWSRRAHRRARGPRTRRTRAPCSPERLARLPRRRLRCAPSQR
jgi:hypothetical protein